jgi:hypothetical protein
MAPLSLLSSCAAALALLARPSLAFDSRNVSESEWACGGGVLLAFPTQAGGGSGGPTALVPCSGEVLWAQSQTRPTVYVPRANQSDLYTLLVLDRDAPSSWDPVRSPLRHMVVTNVSGTDLASPGGWTASAPADGALFNFSGPRPPALSGCHRYYAVAFRQSPDVAPYLAVNASNPSDRLNWDFVSWYASQRLERVGSSFWTTQNADTRNVTGPCQAGPQTGGAGEGRGGGWGSLFAVGVAAAVAAAVGGA